MSKSNNILVVGALSTIAKETIRRLVKHNASRVFLLARDEERLKRLQSDLLLQGAKEVEVGLFDATLTEQLESQLTAALQWLGKIDIALIAHGVLLPQSNCSSTQAVLYEQLITNGVSTVMLMTLIANQMALIKSGTLAVIGSVAGDIGKQSNFAYGSAKAMVEVYAEGLRQKVHKDNVRVLLIKPGMIDTAMTTGMKKGALFCSAEKAANLIVSAINGSKEICYVPGYWRYIMRAFKLLPIKLFKRLTL